MNLIFAAVAVLVMIKTMVNTAFKNMEAEEDWEDEEDWEEENDGEPSRVSDQEYEYFNELLEGEDFDFENFDLDDFENLNFNKLFQDLGNNLQVKLAIMENSEVLKELLLKYRTAREEASNDGENVSDT